MKQKENKKINNNIFCNSKAFPQVISRIQFFLDVSITIQRLSWPMSEGYEPWFFLDHPENCHKNISNVTATTSTFCPIHYSL